MPLLSHLRWLSAIIIIICCGRCVLESHARQLSIGTLHQHLFLFPPSSSSKAQANSYSILCNANPRRYKYTIRHLSSNGNDNNSYISFDERWDMRFKELVQYKREHGDTLVPKKYSDNPQLRTWVDTQRRNKKKNKLVPERVDKLNEIGFVWDVNEAAWGERFQQLKQYEHDHGDTLVPAKYSNNPQLGFWVDTQRRNRKNNKLDPERVGKLNGIGFIWDVKEAVWEEMFQQLERYKHEHGDTLVPNRYTDNPQLGTWVDTQRQNKKKNKLVPERVDKLNEIGFVWDAIVAAWEEMFLQLERYKHEHGDTLVPNSYTDNPQLGGVDTQRQNRKNNKLDPERVDKLNEIGFVWDAKVAAWEEMFQELERYKHEHGDALVPTEYLNNPQLGRWVVDQRQNRKNNKLAPERLNKLNEIGFVWDPFGAAWEEMFQELKKYKKVHGNTLVPCDFDYNPQFHLPSTSSV